MGYAALTAAGTVWGTGFVFGKWALDDLSVGHMVLLRFAFASVGMALPLWRQHRRAPIRIARRDAGLFLAGAIVGVPIQYLVQFHGLARTTVSHASLMVGVLPVLLGVAAAIFTHERLDVIGWLGLIASTAGAALVAFGASGGADGAGPSLFGDLLVVSSLFAGVFWILTSQRLMDRGYSPVVTTAIVTMVGTLFLAIWVLGAEGAPALANLSLRTWLSLAALGLLATTVATLLWNWGLSRIPASQAGVFINLEPVVGALLGAALFHDAFSARSIGGGLLIVVAAVVVSRR